MALNPRLSEPVSKAVRESEKSKCKISRFCGTVATDCPYVPHTSPVSWEMLTAPSLSFCCFSRLDLSGRCRCQPQTSGKARLHVSQMDFPPGWALIKARKQQGGGYCLKMWLWKRLEVFGSVCPGELLAVVLPPPSSHGFLPWGTHQGPAAPQKCCRGTARVLASLQEGDHDPFSSHSFPRLNPHQRSQVWVSHQTWGAGIQ